LFWAYSSNAYSVIVFLEAAERFLFGRKTNQKRSSRTPHGDLKDG